MTDVPPVHSETVTEGSTGSPADPPGPRYDTHRQSLFVLTMWTTAVNICICKTDENLPELSVKQFAQIDLSVLTCC